MAVAICVQELMVIEDSKLEVIGRLVDASNASLLCELSDGSQVIYKPIAGERPLWDFPDGNLASREVAAYYLSNLGNFGVVPKTVFRDGPFGPGAVQQWIEIDENIDVMELVKTQNSKLRAMALLDVVINNTDRKFGHILPEAGSRIYGCDHGVTFHEEDKLRTVLWQFTSQALSTVEISQLSHLLDDIDRDYLQELLTLKEITALENRISKLLIEAKFPTPNPNWPAVPWPPY
jgi:uncharacterized repeat protein (TIGR03843 family)